jgi:hypothetical protein
MKNYFNTTMMSFSHSFFSWEPAKQVAYRLENAEIIALKTELTYLQDIRQVELSTEDQLDEYLENSPYTHDEIFWRNVHALKITGVGENSFYLNESLPYDKLLCAFPTLYDYDYAHHEEQEDFLLEDENVERTIREPYVIRMYHDWGRAFLSSHGNFAEGFTYLGLSNAAAYVYDAVDNYMDTALDKRIPSEYVEGEAHGKQEKEGFVKWDMYLDANGLEAELHWLRNQCWEYLSSLLTKLKIHFSEQSSTRIWMYQDDPMDEDVSTEDRYDPCMNYLFENAQTLKQVRLSHFELDTHALKTTDFSELIAMIAYENDLLETFIQEKFDHVLTDVGAREAKKLHDARKQRRVSISDSAVKALSSSVD